MQFFLGFYRRKSFLSSLVQLVTGRGKLHAFILTRKGDRLRIYHVDDGTFEALSPEEFFDGSRDIYALYRFPVIDYVAATRTLLWVRKNGRLFKRCTQVIAEFQLRAGLPCMVKETATVKQMERWCRDHGYEKII